MKCKIEITENLKREVEVEAKNVHEAVEKVMGMYSNGDIVLTADDYSDTCFHPARCDA